MSSNPAAKRARTTGGATTVTVLPFAGCGVQGHQDGAKLQARLNAPGGMFVLHNLLFLFFVNRNKIIK